MVQRRAAVTAAVGLGGWLAGYLGGRSERRPTTRHPPGHPGFGTVSAASPIPGDAGGGGYMQPAQPGPAPAKNASRVAQVRHRPPSRSRHLRTVHGRLCFHVLRPIYTVTDQLIASGSSHSARCKETRGRKRRRIFQRSVSRL